MQGGQLRHTVCFGAECLLWSNTFSLGALAQSILTVIFILFKKAAFLKRAAAV